jgi:hypothetical protein
MENQKGNKILIMNNYKAMNAYLLVTSINLTLFAIAELEPSKMKQGQKLRFSNLRSANKNFLASLPNSREDKDFLNDQSFDSVGLIVELIGMLSQVHPDQNEWIVEEVKKLIFQSVNRQNGLNL